MKLAYNNNNNNKKYVIGDWPTSTHADPTSHDILQRCAGHVRWPILRPILVFCGSRVPPKCEIPCLGRQWTTVQNLTSLALSLEEKFVTVQKHKRYISKLETVSIAEPLQNRQHVHETPNAVNTRREREWEWELKARREEEGN